MCSPPHRLGCTTSRPQTRNNFLQEQRPQPRKRSPHQPQVAFFMKQTQGPCAQEAGPVGPKDHSLSAERVKSGQTRWASAGLTHQHCAQKPARGQSPQLTLLGQSRWDSLSAPPASWHLAHKGRMRWRRARGLAAPWPTPRPEEVPLRSEQLEAPKARKPAALGAGLADRVQRGGGSHRTPCTTSTQGERRWGQQVSRPECPPGHRSFQNVPLHIHRSPRKLPMSLSL